MALYFVRQKLWNIYCVSSAVGACTVTSDRCFLLAKHRKAFLLEEKHTLIALLFIQLPDAVTFKGQICACFQCSHQYCCSLPPHWCPFSRVCLHLNQFDHWNRTRAETLPTPPQTFGISAFWVSNWKGSRMCFSFCTVSALFVTKKECRHEFNRFFILAVWVFIQILVSFKTAKAFLVLVWVF